MSPNSSEAKSMGNITLLLYLLYLPNLFRRKPLRIPGEKVQIPHHFGPFKSGPIFKIAVGKPLSSLDLCISMLLPKRLLS